MPQAPPPDKRAQVLICHGPSCSHQHAGQLRGELLPDGTVVHRGGCLGMCPVGPNAIARRGEIGPTKLDRRIAPGDTILCSIADEANLAELVGMAEAGDDSPRLLRGRLNRRLLR